MNKFAVRKKNFLSKIDKSRKSEIDKEILSLVDFFNSKDCYFTTSSCAGRIIINSQPKSTKKEDSLWLFVSHQPITDDEHKRISKTEFDTKDMIWFREEPFILHVCAENIESAHKILQCCRKIGLKHSGIIWAGEKIIVEIVDSVRIDLPIYHQKWLIGEEMLRLIVDEANSRLLKSRTRMGLFLKELNENIDGLL